MLASNWDLDDAASQGVFPAFYENVTQGMPGDIALQEAQLAYLDAAAAIHAHPVLWGGITLYGDLPSMKRRVSILNWWWVGLVLVLGGIYILWWRRRKEEAA